MPPSEQQRETRRLMREIAGGEHNAVRYAFDDTLAGDMARFRLRRALRKRYPPEVCEELIFDEATP